MRMLESLENAGFTLHILRILQGNVPFCSHRLLLKPCHNQVDGSRLQSRQLPNLQNWCAGEL